MSAQFITPAAPRLPTYFLPHGAGPCFFMEWQPVDTWQRTASFLAGIESSLPKSPAAIVVVSAHWESPEFRVTANPNPPLIYDYGGFPPHTYQIRYDAPGMPTLASEVVQLLQEAGMDARTDDHRGWDHGAFIPLKVMFPKAQIPVVQLSLKRGLRPDEHIAAGRALAPLRDRGVLLVGSGMSFHNMRGYGDAQFGPISQQFDDWLTQTVALQDPARSEQLGSWTSAPAARLSHPREEHLAPLFVVAGAGLASAGEKAFSDRVLEATLSAYRFD